MIYPTFNKLYLVFWFFSLAKKAFFNFSFMFPQYVKRIPIVLPIVTKTVLQPHQCRNSWMTIWQRTHTAVGSVEETVIRCLLFRFICEFTQGRNPISALCVGSSSPKKVNSKVTRKSTQERNLSRAQTVGRALPTQGPWTDTVSHTQVRGPTTVLYVTEASISPAAWGNMRKSTLGRSLTVQSVTRVLHVLQASRTISDFTQVRGHTAATPVGRVSAAHKAWDSIDENMTRFIWRKSLFSVNNDNLSQSNDNFPINMCITHKNY